MSKVVPFAFGGYRSFPASPNRLADIERVTLIAGANNCGKSNVLRFLVEQYNHLTAALPATGGGAWQFTDLERHQGSADGSVLFGLGMRVGGEAYEGVLTRDRNNADEVRRMLDLLPNEHGYVWFDHKAPTPGQDFRAVFPEQLTSSFGDHWWQDLRRSLSGGRGGGNLLDHWIPESLQTLCPRAAKIECVLVEAIRQVGQSGVETAGFSGVGMIDRLARLQNPDSNYIASEKTFRAINEFVQSVIGDPSARLEVPYKRDTILVHQGGRTLPLPSLGTGVHEVIILAVAGTVLKDHVVCIEEPELHLHPVLQRKLLTYLREKTDNQYFITTHSAVLLDATGATVYHVSHDGTASAIRLASAHAERFEICRSLGYRASDLLQTNCVIWVEGPSDRIYLRHWISLVDESLLEGVHYSIMFYGGRLLSHLTANDPEVSEFISLRRLNRHVAIVIDSDKKSAGEGVNATKRRVADEIEATSGLAWITAGREIENYVAKDVMERALIALRGPDVRPILGDEFQTATSYRNSKRSRKVYEAEKVKLASRVIQVGLHLNQLDLRDRVSELVAFVREANGLSSLGASPTSA